MISVIDYLAGNGPSVLCALNRIGVSAELVSDPENLKGASHIILPGVGSAGATMRSLEESGFIEPLKKHALVDKKPFLGVCVGMQILFEHSEEEDADCLGWLKGDVVRFKSENLRIPQMGWNSVDFRGDCGFATRNDFYYFVNSYHVRTKDDGDIWGVTDYCGEFVSAVNRANIYGTQFHIEKSGEVGLSLLKGFCESAKGGEIC